MEYLPDEILVRILQRFWEAEQAKSNAIRKHPFAAASLVCRRFRNVARYYFPSRNYRVRKLLELRIAACLRASAVWQRKCSKHTWLTKMPNPLHLDSIPRITTDVGVTHRGNGFARENY